MALQPKAVFRSIDDLKAWGGGSIFDFKKWLTGGGFGGGGTTFTPGPGFTEGAPNFFEGGSWEVNGGAGSAGGSGFLDDLFRRIQGLGHVSFPNIRIPWNLPPIPNVNSFFPEYKESELERQKRLGFALEGVRAAQAGFEDLTKTSSARAGIDPSSRSSQQMMNDLALRGLQEESDVRSADFLQSEQQRRAREDLIGQLRTSLEGARLGAGASMAGATASINAQMAALQQQARLQAIMAPFNIISQLMGILQPFGILNNPLQLGSAGGGGGGGSWINDLLAGLGGAATGFINMSQDK